MNIALYYLESPVFLRMTKNENFKSITLEELLESEHVEYLRDDSEIKDNDDFIREILLTHSNIFYLYCHVLLIGL
jgi:hypothetical protein